MNEEHASFEGLLSSDQTLRYLPYDVREVVTTLHLNDLNIFYQCRLIEHCYNYGHGLVMTIMDGMRKGKKNIRRSNKDQPYSSPSEMYEEQVKLAPERSFRDVDLVMEFNPGKKIKPRHAIRFDATSMRNLFYVDTYMLYADYSIQWEPFIEVLKKINRNDIVQVSSEMGGRKYIGLVFLKMEEYIALRDRGRQELLSMSNPIVEPKPPMTEEGRQTLALALDELNMIQTKRHQYGEDA